MRGLVAITIAAILVAMTACSPPAPGGGTQILLFSGTGTSPNDVKAVEAILKVRRLDYSKVNSRQLNSMSESQLGASRLIIVPGGNFIHMGKSLTPGTATNLHNAVQGGLNYLGICAGALLAGHGPHNNFDLTSGVHFDFYGVVNKGIHKAAVAISRADGAAQDHYWEDGPQLTGWGAVVARYPDGTPAVAQGELGKGFVVLSGIHPEAPEDWRGGMTFNTPASADNEFAGKLIDAALQGTRLPHY